MLLDSWAWVEILTDSPKGRAIRRLMSRTQAYASSLSLAEIAFWCKRSGKDPDQYLGAMKDAAAVIDVYPGICEIAGKSLQALRQASPGIGMIDAIIYSQALASGLTLVTGDKHFRGLPNVEFVS